MSSADFLRPNLKKTQLPDGAKAARGRLATSWAPLGASEPLEEIPAPSAIQHGYEHLIRTLNVAPKQVDLTRSGAVSIRGNPTKEKNAVFEFGAMHDAVVFKNLNEGVLVVRPGAGNPAVQDRLELPVPAAGTGDESEPDQGVAFSRAYSVIAQNNSIGAETKIELNSSSASFTDLIHEAAHAYEMSTGIPPDLREGLAEIFASMVSSSIGKDDKRFAFAYNPSYAPDVLAAERFIQALDLETAARCYFGEPDFVGAATQELRSLLGDPAADPKKDPGPPAADEPERVKTLNKLVERMLAPTKAGPTAPGAASASAASASAASASAAPASPSEEYLAMYDTRRKDFASMLHLKATELDLPPRANRDPRETAAAWSAQADLGVATLRLERLRVQWHEADGAARQEIDGLINGHVRSIAHMEDYLAKLRNGESVTAQDAKFDREPGGSPAAGSGQHQPAHHGAGAASAAASSRP